MGSLPKGGDKLVDRGEPVGRCNGWKTAFEDIFLSRAKREPAAGAKQGSQELVVTRLNQRKASGWWDVRGTGCLPETGGFPSLLDEKG